MRRAAILRRAPDIERSGNGGFTVSFASRASNAISASSRTLFGALVSANLNCTLEMHFHRVGKFKRLKVGIREHGGRGAKVFDLGKAAHQFGSCYAARLVDQLDWTPFSVVGKTVSNQHVEFVLLVFDGQNHGHSLANFDYACHFACPWT